MVWQLEDRDLPTHFLIHDRDMKFTDSFDTVFRSEKLKIIRTPYRAPNANVFAERWVRTVREECLDKLIIINQQHLAGCCWNIPLTIIPRVLTKDQSNGFPFLNVSQ